MTVDGLPAAVRHLRSLSSIRQRAHLVLDYVAAGKSAHFRFEPDRLPATAALVAEVTRENYPDLKVPYHSRWRHFEGNGIDRIAAIRARWDAVPQLEQCRRLVELAIVSVLLDAGAGADWQFTDPASGARIGRSEGLALASLALVQSGALSGVSTQPFRVDAAALSALAETTVAAAFQVTQDNPLVGLAGRSQLLRDLGTCLQRQEEVFGRPARLGHFIDDLARIYPDGTLDMADIVPAILTWMADIWPGRTIMHGHNLGDVWAHPALSKAHLPPEIHKQIPEETAGLVPFHKLSQWLSYSLLEPLQWGGFSVCGAGHLTGLAEYRNGGLLVDHGVLVPLQPENFQKPLSVGHEAIVEWRAVTVALLDKLAPMVRRELGLSEDELPLASILQGGTWAAGRKLAYARDGAGQPPISVVSDGTVF